MINDIGRLDQLQIKDVEELLAKVFKLLDDKEDEKAVEMLEEVSNTTNYFLRELIGKLMTNYSNQKKISKIAKRMLTNKIYGIRATALFYFHNRSSDNPDDLISLLEENYDSVPWEVESIIYETWKKKPAVMKEMMTRWLKSDIEKKRIISFHGLELVADRDPMYVLDFLTNALDDESVEVQKKITHILLQVVKSRPAETYPYIREWIMTGSEKRVRSLMISLKKIISIYTQKSFKDKSPDFMTLTRQVLYDWKAEPYRKISHIGHKLNLMIKREASSNGHQ